MGSRHCLGARNDQLKHQRHMCSGQMFYIISKPLVPVTASYKEPDQRSCSALGSHGLSHKRCQCFVIFYLSVFWTSLLLKACPFFFFFPSFNPFILTQTVLLKDYSQLMLPPNSLCLQRSPRLSNPWTSQGSWVRAQHVLGNGHSAGYMWSPSPEGSMVEPWEQPLDCKSTCPRLLSPLHLLLRSSPGSSGTFSLSTWNAGWEQDQAVFAQEAGNLGRAREQCLLCAPPWAVPLSRNPAGPLKSSDSRGWARVLSQAPEGRRKEAHAVFGAAEISLIWQGPGCREEGDSSDLILIITTASKVWMFSTSSVCVRKSTSFFQEDYFSDLTCKVGEHRILSQH